MNHVLLNSGLTPTDVCDIANGARLEVSEAAQRRVRESRNLVDEIIEKGIRAYGVNTGVGLLADTIVSPESQKSMSRNLVMSHAVGVGEPLSKIEVRAIIACAVANHCHGFSGIRWEIVNTLVKLLNSDCIPVVPCQGSVGYLSHMAHIGLVVIGHGRAFVDGRQMTGSEALTRIGLAPAVLEGKEGLSLVGSAPCACGLACVALVKAKSLLSWSNCIAALSFEALKGQASVFDSTALGFRKSQGIQQVGQAMREILQGSEILAVAKGNRTQDALSLRAIPQVHGALFDVLLHVESVLCEELNSVTDNPLLQKVEGILQVISEAHGVAAGVGLAVEYLGLSVAQLGVISERRLDRMVNPLVSEMPAFLAQQGGNSSGFMIAQYTALSLTGDNRRLASPAALDGGVTSGLQEDLLCHATSSALKTGRIVDNVRHILAIELLAAMQASGYAIHALAPATTRMVKSVRQYFKPYNDDRPLGEEIERMATFLTEKVPGFWDFATQSPHEINYLETI
jgi:histidine ammonia-lyase